MVLQKPEIFKKFDQIDTALGEKANVFLNMKSYKNLVGETDDTGRLQRAISDLANGGTLVLEKGYNYQISSKLTITYNNFKIIGNGATITYVGASTTGSLLTIGNTSTKYINSSTTINIEATKQVITLPQSDFNNVSVGDIVQISNTTPYVASLCNGIYCQVQKLDAVNYTIEVNTMPNVSFTANRISVVTPSKNIDIEDLELVDSIGGLFLLGVYNSVNVKVKKLKLIVTKRLKEALIYKELTFI